MIVKLLTEHPLEFLSLKEGCRGSSESTLVKNSNCLKSGATAQSDIKVITVVNVALPSVINKPLVLSTRLWLFVPYTIRIFSTH